jgi:hypothetical protein
LDAVAPQAHRSLSQVERTGVAQHRGAKPGRDRLALSEELRARRNHGALPYGDGFAISLDGFGGGFGMVSRRFRRSFGTVSIIAFSYGFGMVSEGRRNHHLTSHARASSQAM